MGQLLRGRYRPSAAMVVAIVALIIAASGTAVAATQLVSGDSLIKKNSLSGNRLRNRSVQGSKIKLSSLGTVPSASHAATADAATNATNATNATTAGSAPIAKLTYVTASVAVPGTTTPTPATASCPAGTSVLGGGGQVADEADGFIVDDFPVGKTGWTTNFDSSVATTGTTTAICAPAASTAP